MEKQISEGERLLLTTRGVPFVNAIKPSAEPLYYEKMTALDSYKWIPIACCVVSFFSSFGIGANDVANAFATSVGSKALTMKQAVVIASVMEFSGSYLLGGNVASTIMKGITEPSLFIDIPVELMYGMLCVLFGVAVWLILATIYGLPVSTTHSCIGGIIGMAVVAKGWSAVNWKQVGIVASSWIIAPVVSSLLSTCIFVIVRKVILRAPNSVNRALNAYSPIVGFTIAFNLFLVLYKSDSLQINLPIYYIILICIGIGAVVALVLQFTAMPFIRRYVMSVSTEPAIHNDAVEVKVDNGWKTTTEKAGDLTVMTSAPTNVIPLLDMSEEKALEEKLLDEDSTVAQMHSHAEEFDPRTEKLFTYLQIITAVFNSFAHGANDVANSIGPLAACITIYETGDVMQDAKVPAWVLVLGGVGIVVGLICLGYKIMASLGVNMAKVTPSRGFTIEIGSAIIVLFGSAIGLPLSTTHCKVGSTVGVGLVEGKNGVNWKLLYSVFAGWIFTILICAVATGALFYVSMLFIQFCGVC